MAEQLTVYYQVSDEVIKREVVETGQYSRPGRTINFDIEMLGPDIRQKLFDVGALDISSWGSFQTSADIRSILQWDAERGTDKKEPVRLDGEPTIDQVIEIMAANKDGQAQVKEAERAKRQAEVDMAEKLQAVFDTEQAKIREMGLEELKAYRVPDIVQHSDTRAGQSMLSRLLDLKSSSIREITSEQDEKDRLAWINAHGSDHLKKSVDEGFDCKKLYVLERAAHEAPGFEVDYYDAARWEDVSCPSWEALQALDEAKKLDLGTPHIVKMTRPPDNSDSSEYPDDLEEAIEAIMIQDFLGKYNLFQEV